MASSLLAWPTEHLKISLLLINFEMHLEIISSTKFFFFLVVCDSWDNPHSQQPNQTWAPIG